MQPSLVVSEVKADIHFWLFRMMIRLGNTRFMVVSTVSNGLKAMLRHERFLILLRALVAVVGGYALAAALSLVAAHFSVLQGRELRSLIYLVFFSAYGAAIIWLFAINGHRNAFYAMSGANVCTWGLLWGLEAQL